MTDEKNETIDETATWKEQYIELALIATEAERDRDFYKNSIEEALDICEWPRQVQKDNEENGTDIPTTIQSVVETLMMCGSQKMKEVEVLKAAYRIAHGDGCLDAVDCPSCDYIKENLNFLPEGSDDAA